MDIECYSTQRHIFSISISVYQPDTNYQGILALKLIDHATMVFFTLGGDFSEGTSIFENILVLFHKFWRNIINFFQNS